MNLRWLIFDYVGAEWNLSRDDRRAVRWRALQIASPGRRGIVLMLLVALPLLAIYGWGVTHYADRFINSVWPQGGLLLRPLVVYLAVWIVIAWIGRWTYRPAVWRALREHGCPICVCCGYSLRGLPEKTERCPECGAET